MTYTIILIYSKVMLCDNLIVSAKLLIPVTQCRHITFFQINFRQKGLEVGCKD